MLNQWNKYSSNFKQGGFTLLELLAVLAIIAVVSVYLLPAFQEWNAKKSFDRTMNDLFSILSEARFESFERSTSIKVTTTKNGSNYTLTTYVSTSSPPTGNCATEVWNAVAIKTDVITVNSNFNVTGSGGGALQNICFFRDGSSNGGGFKVNQIAGQGSLGNGTIDVYITTGYIDVTKQ